MNQSMSSMYFTMELETMKLKLLYGDYFYQAAFTKNKK